MGWHGPQSPVQKVTMIVSVPRWRAGFQEAEVAPRGPLTWTACQSMVKLARADPVPGSSRGQLDLEPQGGRTSQGVAVRVAKRALALAAAIWHNFRPVKRSPTVYDHDLI
ncbi:Uncharacterised protein [Actinomadura madurae]|nr:Uncharacterised protein [Actinomadura madurae]